MNKKLKLTPQLRIRACDRILQKLYWHLKRSMKSTPSINPEYEDWLQGQINYWEEVKNAIEISL